MRTIRFIYFTMERKSESNKLISKNLNKHRGVLFAEGFNRVKEYFHSRTIHRRGNMYISRIIYFTNFENYHCTKSDFDINFLIDKLHGL